MRAFIPVLVACSSAPPSEPVVVLHEDGIENAYPRLSKDHGRILYQSKRSGTWQLYILDRATGISAPLTSGSNNNLPDWSPDEQHVAFVSDRDGNEEIYVSDLDGQPPRRLTRNLGRDLHPYWSPDGTSLLYNSQRNGPFDVYSIELASGVERRITATVEDETCARYSPDGTQIVLLRNDARGDDLWLLETAKERNVTLTPQVRDGWPMFGPDGWIYFASMETGAFSIYRMRADGQRERLTTPADGEEDARPFISGDGTRLIFNRRRGTAIDIMELALG